MLRRRPRLGVDDVRAFHRLDPVVGLAKGTTGRFGRRFRTRHHGIGKLEAFGPQDSDVHAAPCRRVQGRGRHRERQGSRMIGPAQHELAAVGRDGKVVQRLPVRQVLAGMVHRRLHVDPRRIDEARERIELGLRQVVFQALALCEGAYPYRITIGSDDRHRFVDVFGCDTVHHDTGACLEPVYGHVGRDDERAAAEAGHRRLERGERPERRVQEQQR